MPAARRIRNIEAASEERALFRKYEFENVPVPRGKIAWPLRLIRHVINWGSRRRNRLRPQLEELAGEERNVEWRQWHEEMFSGHGGLFSGNRHHVQEAVEMVSGNHRFFRRRANYLRRLAEGVTDRSVKRRLYLIADNYHHIAKNLQRAQDHDANPFKRAVLRDLRAPGTRSIVLNAFVARTGLRNNPDRVKDRNPDAVSSAFLNVYLRRNPNRQKRSYLSVDRYFTDLRNAHVDLASLSSETRANILRHFTSAGSLSAASGGHGLGGHP